MASVACRKTFFFWENLLPKKYKIWGQKPPILEEFKRRIKILSTYNFLCHKFAAVCHKIATSCSPTVSMERTRDYSTLAAAFNALIFDALILSLPYRHILDVRNTVTALNS